MKSVLNVLLLMGLGCAAFLYLGKRQIVEPTEPTHRYSSRDILFLRRYVSFMGPKGPIGFSPGQEVRLVAGGVTGEDKIAVTDGTHSVVLDKELLTHDMDLADALRANDSAEQASAQSGVSQASSANAQQEHLERVALADEINTSEVRQASADTVGNYQSALHPSAATGATRYYPATIVYYPIATAANAPATNAPSATGTVTGGSSSISAASAVRSNLASVVSQPLPAQPHPVLTGPSTQPLHNGVPAATLGGAATLGH